MLHCNTGRADEVRPAAPPHGGTRVRRLYDTSRAALALATFVAAALFYTRVIGAGALAPIAYGVIADHVSCTIGSLAAALTATAIIPLVLALRPIREEGRGKVERSARP